MSMQVVYDSLTGQCERFARRLDDNALSVLDYEETSEPILLITRSYNFGEIPEDTIEFLDRYHEQVLGVAVSGNRNWGTNYGAAGDKISQRYGIELVLKFEGSGFKHDVETVLDWMKERG